MSTVENRGGILEVNTHAMSNKPDSVPFDENYTQPIDILRHNTIHFNLCLAFPGQENSVIGAPWDYKLADPQDLHKGTMIGHYRVQIDGTNYLACVDEFDHPAALSLGADIFEQYKKSNIDVLGIHKFPDGDITKPLSLAEGILHLEEFRPDAITLSNPKARLNGRQNQLGKMIGKMYNAGAYAPHQLRSSWFIFSQGTSIKAVKEGLKIFNQGEGMQALKALVQQSTNTDLDPQALSNMFDEIAQRVQTKIPDILNHGRYAATSFNAIDKMVLDNPDGSFGFKSHHTAAHGFVPRVSRNATHDIAFALSRIVAKEALYDGDNKKAQIKQGMEEAIKGYNDVTGLSLTFNEAVEAMKNQSTFQMLFGLGYEKLAKGHQHTTQDLANSMQGTLEQFENINALS